jgi:hypothetical protein
VRVRKTSGHIEIVSRYMLQLLSDKPFVFVTISSRRLQPSAVPILKTTSLVSQFGSYIDRDDKAVDTIRLFSCVVKVMLNWTQTRLTRD